MSDSIERTRRSWNFATRLHNGHKGDQAARLAAGDDTVFPEELALLGALEGVRLVHLQCNSGQDSLCLARRGAQVVGVDLSDEAIDTARSLSRGSGIPARFERSEVVSWLQTTDERFDVAFTSYGALPWLPDLSAWARGVHRVLVAGGRLVVVEFHPLAWSFDPTLGWAGDDYFADEPFVEPVEDYVAASGTALGAVADDLPSGHNPHDAVSWQHTVGQMVQAVADAGLRLEVLRERPYSNGARLVDGLVAAPGRRWVAPPGVPRIPLLIELTARKPTGIPVSAPGSGT